jgi:hypothetical protein
MRRGSVFALVSAIITIVGALWLPGVAAQTPAGPDYDLPGGGHFYTQTNAGAGAQFGYRITDEGGIGFWSEFKRLGGVTALGYPASRRFQLDGFFVQATQKYILQWRPEVGQVFFVNVFDKLHDQGKDSALQSQFGIPAPVDPGVDQATRLGYLNADPAVAGQYGTGPGAIQANGLPTSQLVNQGVFSIIRNQRDAIQKWNQPGPGGIQPGQVSVVNGGDVSKALGLVSSDAQITETAQGQPAATPTPIATATPTATPVPQFGFLSKDVTTAPMDCGNGNRVPCVNSAPNAGLQYVQGHVVDKNGNGVCCFNVTMAFYGNTITVGTEGDGLFTHTLSSNCPIETRVYNFYITDGSGKQASDMKTITYTNCNNAGEFHFDFVKQS